MRLRLFDRIRRFVRPRRSEAGPAPQGRHRRGQRRESAPGPTPDLERAPGPGQWSGTSGTLTQPAATPPDGWPAPRASFVPDAQPVPARRASGPPAVRVGEARARVREAPPDAAVAQPSARTPSRYAERPTELDHEQEADSRAGEMTPAAARVSQQAGRPSWRAAQARLRAKLPFVDPHPRGRPRSADGRRNCGSLETILWRQWDAALLPPPETVEAIDRLAELPEQIKARLAAGLDWIFVGPGGVPELDEMTALRGVRLPSGQATWDACAGAYGERKVVVGSQPSPTPDVMCHEIGHALDDLDSPPGKWQSDSAQFRILYDQCQPHLASDFHRQPGGLGRKEFFADAFAAIASGQRPALVDMLSGDTRTALRVMLYFNRRYGI
jgi:hypothetical protein